LSFTPPGRQRVDTPCRGVAGRPPVCRGQPSRLRLSPPRSACGGMLAFVVPTAPPVCRGFPAASWPLWRGSSKARGQPGAQQPADACPDVLFAAPVYASVIARKNTVQKNRSRDRAVRSRSVRQVCR
jgi:hypothetical protein